MGKSLLRFYDDLNKEKVQEVQDVECQWNEAYFPAEVADGRVLQRCDVL